MLGVTLTKCQQIHPVIPFAAHQLFTFFVYILIETRIAPLNGVDEFDFTENKKIINEALKFIHLSKFEWCDV